MIRCGRIETRNDITGDAAHRDRLPRAHDEVGESHHPAGGETDGARKDRGGIGNFSCCVGHGDDQLAVDPPDGKQDRAADDEAEQRAECASAQQPVIHDDEPAHAHHGSPAQREVVGGAELAGESGHWVRLWSFQMERREL
jgi:hypothetical protein